MQVKLISHTPEPDIICMRAAIMCRNSAPSMDVLRRALAAGHDSLLEQANFSFEVKDVSRVLTHQFVRHRIASFAQQSQRHTIIEGLDWYVVPPKIAENQEALGVFHAMMENDRQGYVELLRLGIEKEDARFVLPNSAHTMLVLNMNARSLHNFFALRCCNRAQWEIRDLANTMLRQVKLVAPIIFAGAGRKCGICKEPCDQMKEV